VPKDRSELVLGGHLAADTWTVRNLEHPAAQWDHIVLLPRQGLLCRAPCPRRAGLCAILR